MRTRIVHLSDLHLGNDFVLRSLRRRRVWWQGESPLLSRLAEALRKLEPDYVVITGDVVNKASSRTFRAAVKSLTVLFTRANIDIQSQVLILPGNHDVKVRPPRHKYLGHLPEFLKFLKDFYGESSYRVRTERFVRLDPERRLCIVALDSTFKGRVQAADGEIGEAQFLWLDRKYKELCTVVPAFDGFVKIVALHHHPHPISGAGSDRFLQLNDAARAQVAFQQIGANLVLHGHQHYPHCLCHKFEAAHYHVVGAGTATCSYPEEQAGEGNSFNVLEIQPEVNLVSVIRYKADQDKRFQELLRRDFPLFPPGDAPYKTLEHQSLIRITDLEGNCVSSDRRIGLRAVSPEGNGKRRVEFYLAGLPEEGEIVEFGHEKGVIAEVEFVAKDPKRYEGFLVLREPLKWGGDPVDVGYTFRMRRAFRMWRTKGEESPPESIEIEIVLPCDQVAFSVEFPPDYLVKVQGSVRNSDREAVPLALPGPLYDPIVNRHTWVVRSPRLRYIYSLAWALPERPAP